MAEYEKKKRDENQPGCLPDILITVFAGFTLFVGTGIIFTVIISIIFVNSPDYCRDCNIGLGLYSIGFTLSLFVTPFLIYFLLRDTQETNN